MSNKNGIMLMRINFDSLENREPKHTDIEAIFIDSPEKNCHIKLKEYLKNRQPIVLYSGYDHEIYPKFKIIEITIY
jgi:hypothetical protein